MDTMSSEFTHIYVLVPAHQAKDRPDPTFCTRTLKLAFSSCAFQHDQAEQTASAATSSLLVQTPIG